MNYHFFENIIEKNNKICYSTIDNRTVSYREYFNDICQCLDKINHVCPDLSGVHVGLLADNTYEYIVILGALFLGRAFIVPINTYESHENIKYIINNADVEILIVSDSFESFNANTTLRVSDITGRDNGKIYNYEPIMEECIDETKL